MHALNFSDVLIIPKIYTTIKTRKDVSVVNNGLTPIIASNMDTIGTMEVARELTKLKCLTILHKYYNILELLNFFIESETYYDYVGISSGINEPEKLYEILDVIKVKYVCLDVAHGGMKHFIKFCKDLKKRYPEIILIAGNICTYKGYSALCKAGVDIVKAGIGGGSVCTTRDVTGVGYPQLQMILDIKRKQKWYQKALLISDGNCKTSGDICKALVAGADFVMVGGMLSGTTESAGEITEIEGVQYKKFYGMSSSEAHGNKNFGVCNGTYKAPEGISKMVPLKGPVSVVINNALGGIRSCCSYLGVSDSFKLKKASKFILLK